MGGRQAAIHGEIRYQGIEIAAGMDAVILELPVKIVAADRVVCSDQDREIGIVSNFFAGIVQAADSLHARQPLSVGRIDPFAPCKGLVYVFQLQQPQGRVEFAHLAVNAGSHHGGLAHVAEVLQLVDAHFGFGIGTHDSAAFKGVEHFGGMEAQHGQITVPEYAATLILHTERMRGVVDDVEVVVVGDLLNGFDSAGVSVTMHRHDRGGLRGDGRFDPLRI